MKLPEYSQYIGRMKHPLQDRRDNPSMYMLSDSVKKELDLILLTPGTFMYAYSYVRHLKPRTLFIYAPSLRPDFLSDIYNLYMMLKDTMPVNWVFPEGYDHYDFSLGHIVEMGHVNYRDNRLSVSYVKNEVVDNVYDIIVRSVNGVNYFSFHLTEDKLNLLYRSKKCTWIHLPKSSTIYGGLTYDSVVEISPKYKQKLVPYDFSSIEDLYLFKGRRVPDWKEFNRFYHDLDEDRRMLNYEDDVDDAFIDDLLLQDTREGATDDDII